MIELLTHKMISNRVKAFISPLAELISVKKKIKLKKKKYFKNPMIAGEVKDSVKKYWPKQNKIKKTVRANSLILSLNKK